MSSVPRNPEFYFPTEHAVVRKKERNIKWEWVAKTIEEGREHPSYKEDCRTFMHEIEGDLIYVAANTDTGEILTVLYYK